MRRLKSDVAALIARLQQTLCDLGESKQLSVTGLPEKKHRPENTLESLSGFHFPWVLVWCSSVVFTIFPLEFVTNV